MGKRYKRNTPKLDRLRKVQPENEELNNNDVKLMIYELRHAFRKHDRSLINNFYEFLRLDDSRITQLEKPEKEELYEITREIARYYYNEDSINFDSLCNLYNAFLKLDMPEVYADSIVKTVRNEEICSNVANEGNIANFTEYSLVANTTLGHYNVKLNPKIAKGKEEKHCESLLMDSKRDEIFPQSYVYTIPGSTTQVEIYYNKLTEEAKHIAEKTISEAHRRVEKIKKKYNLLDKEPNSKLKLFLFDNYTAMRAYGGKLGLPADHAKGYAFCQSDSKGITSYNAYVYQDTKEEGENGFDRGFFSLGHEVVHLLTFKLTGGYNAVKLPDWFKEGMADALGRGGCLDKHFNHIKKGLNNNRRPGVGAIINADGDTDKTTVYGYAGVLFNFMNERYHQIVGKVFKAAIKGDDKDEIATLIDKGLIKEGINDEFYNWFKASKPCLEDVNNDKLEINPATKIGLGIGGIVVMALLFGWWKIRQVKKENARVDRKSAESVSLNPISQGAANNGNKRPLYTKANKAKFFESSPPNSSRLEGDKERPAISLV